MSMTENEAIRVLKNGWHFAILLEDKQLIDIAIQALEKQSMVNEILHELREYSAIGTVEEFKALKEKNEPKKPFFNGANYECPNCKTQPYEDYAEDKEPMYCNICGQKLDFGKEG